MFSDANEKICFFVNGEKQEVSTDLDFRDSLNDYIRNKLNLRGTKTMCKEGGCGVCIVNIKETHPVTHEEVTYAANSCLVSPLSCHGKEITTIEGLGNQNDGYHPIQRRLAMFNGSQCGFCSPGWVMNMYSALESSNHNLTMKEIENYFGGNLCRCTGYRPILDSMKSFATDCSVELKQKVRDIEDLDKLSQCSKTGKICNRICDEYEKDYCFIDAKELTESQNVSDVTMLVDSNESKWFRVYSLEQLFSIFRKEGTETYKLIGGNTAKGVYPETSQSKIMIDITEIVELRTYSIGTNLILGGSMTISETMSLFKELALKNIYFSYLNILYEHLNLVAHVPVRNIATLAGNLSIKHEHPEFPSDIFLLFETIGAVVMIGDQIGRYTMSLSKYLLTNMKGKIIISIELPPLGKDHILETFKITRRTQNSHAIVNAGFLFKLKTDPQLVVQSARLVYGNINSNFIHASKTENVLKGQSLINPKTLLMAMDSLKNEINPDFRPPEPSPEYRKILTLALFYKFILKITPYNLVDNKYVSGANLLERPLSSGKQYFDTNSTEYPLTKPVIKLEAMYQTAGEAKFINDTNTMPGEYFATFVSSTIHRGILASVDTTEALKIKGVVKIYTAGDIPGTNVFTPLITPTTTEEEDILVNIGGTVKFNGQPLAIIVADNDHALKEAAALVKVEYKDITPIPVLTIQDALAAPSVDKRVVNNQIVHPTGRGTNVKKILKGTFFVKSQYHFHMETQTCICIPLEDGIEVISASQWLDQIQVAVASALKIQESSVNVTIRRLGGSYGGKLSRATQVACSCALVAKKLNKPVRFVMPFEMNMKSMGKKQSTLANYEVAVDDNGKIQYLSNIFYHNNGCSSNETVVSIFAVPAFSNCYDSRRWYISANTVLTDIPSNTYFRAPGSCEGIAMAENIMDHIAHDTGLDPIEVRLANLEVGSPLAQMIEEHTKTTNYYRRLEEINEYNYSNRWKKKGLGFTVMKYPLFYLNQFAAAVSIYHADGSVAVTHSGIEMGQGINTKVAQVVAFILGVPLGSINVKPSNSTTTPNAFCTAGSMASDLCCYSAKRACEILLERMAPVQNTLDNPTWLELVTASYNMGVDLHSTYMYSDVKDPVKAYPIFAVCVTEVEIDILTGNHIITRVDILEDAGDSLSPLIDVGQVEGAFMMGIGYWTLEELKFDKTTGELITNRTWNYKVPGAKDIPVDFRVYFRRNSPNPLGVLRAKTTGEPPLTMSFSIATAIRHALKSARIDAGLDSKTWFELRYPLTSESICLASGINPSDFKFNSRNDYVN